jgi:hypothetical protein
MTCSGGDRLDTNADGLANYSLMESLRKHRDVAILSMTTYPASYLHRMYMGGLSTGGIDTI